MAYLFPLIILSLLFNIQRLVSGGETDDDNTQLFSEIFKNYQKTVRPVTPSVLVSLTLMSLHGLDETSETLTTSLHVTLKWSDRRLRWSSNRIEPIQVSLQQIWFPQLTFANGGDNLEVSSTHLANIDSQGHVDVSFHAANIKTKCPLLFYDFPFDKQTCNFQLVSSDGFTNVTLLQLFLIRHLQHAVWKLKESPNSSQPGSVELKRKSQKFVIKLILPLALVNILVILLFAFPAKLQLVLSNYTFFMHCV